ncbi:hypothetical protein HDU80_008566 [Chytriomyces hyalinus]|nr:hypothetical protein HDU80_008566 [Chytriomyces hyalinus]
MSTPLAAIVLHVQGSSCAMKGGNLNHLKNLPQKENLEVKKVQMPATRATTVLPRPALRRSARLEQIRSEKLNQTLESAVPVRKSKKRGTEDMSHVDQRQERPKRIKVIFAEKPAEEEVGTSSQDNTQDSVVAVDSGAQISSSEISVEQESEAEDLHSWLRFPRRVYRPSRLSLAVVAIDEELVSCPAVRPASIGVNACRIAHGFDKSQNGPPDRQPRLLALLQQKLIQTEMAEIQRQWELEQAAALEALAAEIEAELFGGMD